MAHESHMETQPFADADSPYQSHDDVQVRIVPYDLDDRGRDSVRRLFKEMWITGFKCVHTKGLGHSRITVLVFERRLS